MRLFRRRDWNITVLVDPMEFDEGRGRLWTHGDLHGWAIPAELAEWFAPAQVILYEWTDYWVRYNGARMLRIGDRWQAPIDDGLFLVRFENRLGLTRIQPFDEDEPLCAPLNVEILSPKVPSPAAHAEFFGTLLNDLFARAAALPFASSAETARAVVEASEPPTLLFAFYFLLHHAVEMHAACAIVHAAPHRMLADRPAVVPLAAVAEADADVLLAVLRNPDRWTPARGFRLAERLGGYAPVDVWQRRPEETFDTAENRFVLAFLSELLAMAERLLAQPWWPRVSAHRRRIVAETVAVVRFAVVHPMFADVGWMERMPVASRVLMRREGYRQMLILWQVFNHSSRPMFANLQRAIDVRDVAALYEGWVFFALADEIGLALGQPPSVSFRLISDNGIEWLAEARFGDEGRLTYNLADRSYSRLNMRPDFWWRPTAGSAVVFDAKFRFDRADLEPDDEGTAEHQAKHDDLYRMHTYRDALGVRAAVCVYPGDVAVFFDHRFGRRDFVLRELLLGDWSGVGALPMRPVGAMSTPVGDVPLSKYGVVSMTIE